MIISSKEIKEVLNYIDDRVIPNEKWDLVKAYITKIRKENQLLRSKNLRLNNIIDTITEMFERDEHFEDGCYCYEIEKYVKELKGE